MEEHLKSTPLVEALLEVRWQLRQQQVGESAIDPAYPLIVGLLYDRTKKRFPFVEELPQSHLPPVLLQYAITHRFRAGQDRWPLVQVGPGIASLNFTVPYRWRKFAPAARVFVSHLGQAYEVAASQALIPEQLSLRYINAIDLDQDVSVLRFLEEYLHTTFKLPTPSVGTAAADEPAAFRFQIVHPIGLPQGLAILNMGMGQREDRPALLCDLSVVSDQDSVPSLQDFPQWLSSAHDVIEDWFYRLVEGNLYERFRKGA